MAKTLFDHIKQITDVQNPKYWDTLDESERKTWSTYMVIRFLSMNPQWVELIAEIQPYLQMTPAVPSKAVYLVLIGLIPKSKSYLKYMKPKKDGVYEKWLIQLVAKHYEVSLYEAEDYLDILYASKDGKEHIKDVARKYAIDDKEVKKLKI